MKPIDEAAAKCYQDYINGQWGRMMFLSRLYEIAYVDLRNFIRRRHRHLSLEDAEDIAQEALLRLMMAVVKTGRPKLTEQPLMPWLYLAANNLVRDRARSAASHPTVELKDYTPAELVPPADVLLHELLDKAMATLSERELQVLYMKFEEGMTADEVAEKLGIPASTVNNDIKTIRQAIRGIPDIEGLYKTHQRRKTGL